MEKEVKNVKVSVSASGGAQISGASQQSVSFVKPGDQLVFFKLKTGNKSGKTTLRVTAEGAGKKVSETIEIELRNPNPAVTLRESKWIENGQSCELSYRLGSRSPENSVKLEISRIPPVDISRRFDFLYNYQHYCTEQLTSKALPLLFISQFKAVDRNRISKNKGKCTGSNQTTVCPSVTQRRIYLLAGECFCQRMDNLLCRNVPGNGTGKRICRKCQCTQ